MHKRPRPRMLGVKERLSQYKFDAIKIKTLEEMRQVEQTRTSTTGRIVTKQSPVKHATNGEVLYKNQRSSKGQSAITGPNHTDGGGVELVDKPSFKVKDVLHKASLQLQGTTNSETNIKNPPGNMKLVDPSRLFSSEHKQSSESIFSPKFNPTSSQPSSAQSNTSDSVTSPAYKFNFDDVVCEVSKENISTVADAHASKRDASSKESPSHSVSKQSPSLHVLKGKPVKLKRPATSVLKDMPETKKVNRSLF